MSERNKNNLSDYRLPRTDINKLLPAENTRDAKILEGFNHNLFNRFLTKDEVERIVGFIGKDDFITDPSLQKIQEPTPYRENNQLQPMVYSKVGNVDWFMSFVDFMVRLQRLGVPIERFNEWGNSLQFNWVPPIDIDKLINFQDYFWDNSTPNDPPQYVTVKNQCTWAKGRKRQILSGVINTFNSEIISGYNDTTNSIGVFGNIEVNTGEIIIISGNALETKTYNVTSSSYDPNVNETTINVSSNISTGELNGYTALTRTEITVVSSDTNNNQVTISGDVTNLFSTGYVFSTEDSVSGQPVTLWSVSSAEFNESTNTTTITTNEDMGVFDWNNLSVKPLIRSILSEYNEICNLRETGERYTRVDFSGFNEVDLGEIIWVRNILLLEGTDGETSSGSSTFSDTVTTGDFSSEVSVGDILRVKNTGLAGDYKITNVVNSNILDTDRTWFGNTNIEYEIVKERSLLDISSDNEPVGVPNIGQLWFDTSNNQLREYDGSQWTVVVDNFNILVDLNHNAHLVNLIQSDDWSAENKWVHKSDIDNFSKKIRAQLPIIEFFPYLTFTSHTFAVKEWRYRATTNAVFSTTTTEPALFELIDTTKTPTNYEISFQDSTTLLFDAKFGNLTESLTPDTEIRLGDFGSNTGISTVASSTFEQIAPGQRYRTKVILTTPVNDPLDVPDGAYVGPVTTSEGDPWLSPSAHWQLQGIEDIFPSSIVPERNPMIDSFVTMGSNAQYDYILNLYSQEFQWNDPTVSSATFNLDPSLHDLVLYEDYQEGDIRVYLNGERQYGNYSDFEAGSSGYVGSIILSTEITQGDIIRIELGEYAISDVGKRAVEINTVSGNELYNLVDFRKLEQVKTETNEYPQFSLYDVKGKPFRFASSLFRYKDDPDGTYIPEINQRVTYDTIARDYTFEQFLVDGETEELYLYEDTREYGDELQTIWKKGINNEQYVPTVTTGFWDIPNQLYFNPKHENRKVLKLTELFRHFDSIVNEQSTPGIVRDNFTNVFHLDNVPNYGLGGRIKEHNDGFDTLLSAIFVNNVNPIDLMQFAHNQYKNAQVTIREILDDTIISHLETVSFGDANSLISFIEEDIKDTFEKNDRRDQWFGDSTTFNEATNEGVKNWIATLPYLGMFPKNRPYLISDRKLNIFQLVHHDGHRENVSLSQANIESILRRIESNSNVNSDNQTVATDSASFPATINGDPATQGDLLIRNVTSDKVRKLYRFNNLGQWERIDLSNVYANVLLNIEQALYDLLPTSATPENFSGKFDFKFIRNDVDYNEKIQEQFSAYTKRNKISLPLANNSFKQNDPFTWNYAYTNINTDPLTGGNRTDVSASWQGLYDKIYGTPYPHLEPWALQGYNEKPTWWDSNYADVSLARRWKSSMWGNILNGIIPVGFMAPDGVAGTGIAGQISNIFSYVPVNIDSVSTSDGYAPDALLPPFWNSDNTTLSEVRTPHDAALNEFVVTPSATYEFSQNGPNEWEWRTSSQFLYDDAIVAFKLQPLKFINQLFGQSLIDVACLQVDERVNKVASHEDVQFHGDLDENNQVVKVDGLNQWYVHYNRYNGFDGISSEFRELWTNWETPLTYQFSAFIDTRNFDVSSDIFDVTSADYDVMFKRTVGIRDVYLDALDASIISMPSKYAPQRESGIGWTIQMDNTSPIGRPISRFGVQNYPVKVNATTNTFRTFSFDIDAVELENSFGFDTVQYSETATPTGNTQLLNNSTVYYASVLFDGTTTVNLEISGKNAQTYAQLVNEINSKISGNGSAFLQDGNLVIASDTVGGTTSAVITDAGLFSSVSPFFAGTSGNTINQIKFNRIFYIADDVAQYFITGDQLVIRDSTNYNGTYTISTVSYSPDTELTKIEVLEDVNVTNSIVDGIIEPSNPVTLPSSWITGVGLNWTTNGILPQPFNQVDLYYIIRLNDREFQLAATRAEALATSPTPISVTRSGTKQSFVGRIQRTFRAFSGRRVGSYWRQHFVDTRRIIDTPGPVTISGVQNMIDFVNGYGAYLEGLGFIFKDEDGTNRDPDTGREKDWQFETEELVEFLYSTRSIRQESNEEYLATVDASTDSFKSDDLITWVTGTRVTLKASENGTLPDEFNSPVANTIPYYVIQNYTTGQFQLAASRADAVAGRSISFTDTGSGKIVITLSRNEAPSTLRLNPFETTLFVENTVGVLGDVFAGSDLDLITNQRVYDQNFQNFENKDLIVSRRDQRSEIELSNGRLTSNQRNTTNARFITGMHLFFDGYEHIIKFPSFSSSSNLIYDPFLGINIPRFGLEFYRNPAFTLRPNVGGDIVLDSSQIQNIESAVDELRSAYSTYTSKEGDTTTLQTRKSLGYDGPYDYADDINITDKSQFIFYRGFIQRKGTNFAADAFTNQVIYDQLDVDEFWAYRLGCFGDIKQKDYIEMYVKANELDRKEIRYEFVVPTGAALNDTFIPVDLADTTRWFDQPDQVEKLLPRDRLYINPKVKEIFDGTSEVFSRNGSRWIQLSEPADAAFISYSPTGDNESREELEQGIDYEFVSTTLIKFNVDVTTAPYYNVVIYTLAYNYDAQNPAVMLNDERDIVLTDVPIWNPARQQYYNSAYYLVNYRKEIDPARYNNYVDTTEAADDNYWDGRYKDQVWFDISTEDYLPFDDPFIETDIDTRLKNWGKLSNWGEIRLYQWTESDVPPNEYDQLAASQETNGSLPVNERKTGRARKQLYESTGASTWELREDERFFFVAPIHVSGGSHTFIGEEVEVYVDGILDETAGNASGLPNIFDTVTEFDNYVNGVSGNKVTVIKRKHVPTRQELENGDYKYDTPYSVVNKINSSTGETKPFYYFWVEDRLDTIQITGGARGSTTLKAARDGLQAIPIPYMIPDKIVDLSNAPYNELFSLENSLRKKETTSYEFPYAYSRVIIKNINSRLRNDAANVLRFTRDFTLRDRLANDDPYISELERKNVHWEWKLFREKQFSKIDRNLWNAITESILGFEYDGGPVVSVTPTPTVTPSMPTPTPTPTVSGTPGASVTPSPTAEVTSTPEPTPTLTPDVTPTNSPTPEVTPSNTIPPSPTPSITPSSTPVASPEPSQAVVYSAVASDMQSYGNPGSQVIASLVYNTDGSAENRTETENPPDNITTVIGNWSSLAPNEGGNGDVWIFLTTSETDNELVVSGSNMNNWYALDSNVIWNFSKSVGQSGSSYSGTYTVLMSLDNAQTIHDGATFTVTLYSV